LRAGRAQLLLDLAALAGVQVWPSAANFILFRTGQPADTVFAALRQQGVLIKDLSGAGGVLANCLRVTVGTPEENAAFLAALRKAL
jgi:histidinol-phosphate aminotransferase